MRKQYKRKHICKQPKKFKEIEKKNLQKKIKKENKKTLLTKQAKGPTELKIQLGDCQIL